MGRRTQFEIATDTLRSILAHLEPLAEMGVPLHIPTELADSCEKIARLAGVPVGNGNIDATVLAKKVAEGPASSLKGEVSTPRAATEAAHLRAVADVDTHQPVWSPPEQAESTNGSPSVQWRARWRRFLAWVLLVASVLAALSTIADGIHTLIDWVSKVL